MLHKTMAESVYLKNEIVEKESRGPLYEAFQRLEYSNNENYEKITNEHLDGPNEYLIGDGQDIPADRCFVENSNENLPIQIRCYKSDLTKVANKPIADRNWIRAPNITNAAHNGNRRPSALFYQPSLRTPLGCDPNEIDDSPHYAFRTLGLSSGNCPKQNFIGGIALSKTSKYGQYKPERILRRVCKPEIVRRTSIAHNFNRMDVSNVDTTNVTYDQFRNIFIDQYGIRHRKQVSSKSSIPNRSQESMDSPRIVSSEKRDWKIRMPSRRMHRGNSCLENENCSDLIQKELSEIPVNENENENILKLHKVPEEAYQNICNMDSVPNSINMYQVYENSYAYNELLELKTGNKRDKSPLDESSIEVKYKNEDFHENEFLKDPGFQTKYVSHPESWIEKSSVCESSATNMKSADCSEENVCMAKNPCVSEEKNSTHSGISKPPAVNKKHFNDLVNLERSKCNVLSEIDTGLHRIEQSRNESNCTPKSGNSRWVHSSRRPAFDSPGKNSDEKVMTCKLNVVRSDFINNMFKEYRGYHLENMKQEIKRIQYLDSLPEKWVKQKFSSTL